uniref:FERM domain-containing protein n=1 Tax=Anopheles minimus TaxID=112268 RepID=A0A182W498_9DIPT
MLIDLFREVVSSAEPQQHRHQPIGQPPELKIKRSIESFEEQKYVSDTDSGRSSDHGELLEVHRKKEPPGVRMQPNIPAAQQQQQQQQQSYGPIVCSSEDYREYGQTTASTLLKVKRPPTANNPAEQRFCSLPRPYDRHQQQPGTLVPEPYPNYHTISYTKSVPRTTDGPGQQPDQHQGVTVRRRHNAELLAARRRADYRRNTIDVTMVEVKMAEAAAEHQQRALQHQQASCFTGPGRLIPSKSINHLASLAGGGCEAPAPLDQSSFNATSMPNLGIPLTTVSIATQTAQCSNSRKELPHPGDSTDPATTHKGPEFIVNSHSAPKSIDLTDAKTQHRRIVTILLLNGTKVNVTCNPTTTLARHIFEAILRLEGLGENFFLGLCALIGGDFVFLPLDLKIYKVAPQIWINTSKKSTPMVENVVFMLYVRIKFFLPTLRGVSCVESRHLLYLQLRKSILERQILCAEDDLIALGGLALQSEIGSFKEHMKYSEYFTISHYLPEEVYRKKRELARYLRNAHFHKRGLHQREAEHNFIRYVQELKEYGLHLYSASWATGEGMTLDVYVAISLAGVAIFERNMRYQPRASQEQQECRNGKNSFMRHLYAFFDWLEIENICFSKHAFCVVVRRSETLGSKSDKNLVKYKLRMDGRKSYFAFNLASEHHKFYMKLRNSFISIKTLASELNIPIEQQQNSGTTMLGLDEDGRKKRTVSELMDGNHRPSPDPAGFDAKNIEKIDKPFKTTGLRVRNLKKSMLNDNRLARLRQRFLLKRSKSTVEPGSAGTSALNLTVEITNQQNQNKENENPFLGGGDSEAVDGEGILTVASPGSTELTQSGTLRSHQSGSSPSYGYDQSQLLSPEDSPKTTHSMNRNKVKMGTKVFSAQFLNKSFDNLAAAAGGSTAGMQGLTGAVSFQNVANISRSSSGFLLHEDEGETGESNTHPPLPSHPLIESSVDEVLSVKSSMGSVYFMEKIDEQSVGGSAETLLSPKACVIPESSIRSESCQFELPMTDETISDTLLEKFNNISQCGGASNDRILATVLIVKDTILGPESETTTQRQFLSRSQESIAFPGKWSLMASSTNSTAHYDEFDERFPYATMGGGVRKRNRENTGTATRYTLGISIVQGNDNNVYVKDLAPNGPGARNGVRVGDQIIAVNGKSLLNLPYAESLSILQQTGRTVELVLSQIFQRSQPSPPVGEQQQHQLQPRPPTVTKSNSLYIKNGSRSATTTPLLDQHTLPPPPSYTKHYEDGDRMAKIYTQHLQQHAHQRKQLADGVTTEGSTTLRTGGDNNTGGGSVSQRYTKNVADILRTRNRIALAERSQLSSQQPPPAYAGLSPSKSMPDLPKILQAYSKHPPTFGAIAAGVVGPVRNSTRLGSSVKLPGHQDVLPPLPKLPKLKKLRQWNGGSLLSLNQFPNLPAAFNLGSGGGGVTAAATSTSTSSVPRGDFGRQHHPAPPRKPQHMRHSSDISIISAAVSSRTPADYSHRDNLGLYALKCDRSAAKRGILLNLPRKITQAVGGTESSGVAPATMVHEKFSPCKRRPAVSVNELPEIKPPPRRRKRPPANEQRMQVAAGQPDADLSRWQKNSSELFRIVERESASAARARSAGGVGLLLTKKPHRVVPPKRNNLYEAPTSSSDGAVVELVEQVKAQSVDNLLAMRYHRRRRGAFAEPERPREESDSESDRQVQSLRIHQHHPPHHHRRTASAVNGKVTPDQPVLPHQPVKVKQRHIQPPSGATSLPTTVAVGGARPFPLDRACDFSIENNSDEIEVRFRKGYSTDESSETATTVAIKLDDTERKSGNTEKLPLPPRVVQLRGTDTGPSNRVIKPAESPTRAIPKPTQDITVGQPDPSVRQFMPLAEVLRKSIDSAELKRKWINDFLSQGSETNGPEDEPTAKLGGSNALEPFVPQLDIVQRMDRQLEELEGTHVPSTAITGRQGSNGSVDIFRRTNCDFEEFDELFTSAERTEQCGGRKTVKLSEQITYIDRSSTTSNLCFSSSSFSCASMEDGKPSLPSSAPPSLPPPAPPPPPPPPPPPLPFPADGGMVSMDGEKHGKRQSMKDENKLTGYRSTVKIQDYSSKHLQRVRYLSSPSPSRSSVVELHAQGNPRLTDSGSETDHNMDNGHHRKANNNTVRPLNERNHGNSYGRANEVTASNSKLQQQSHRQFHLANEQDENSTNSRPEARKTNAAPLPHPEAEKLPQIKHSTVAQGRRNHDVQPDRHPAPTGTIGIRSVLPDYSEYYNEEGVIII